MTTLYRKVKSSKRLPKDGRDVFGFVGEVMRVCCCDSGAWYTDEEGVGVDVEYWLEPIQPRLKLF